jgi:hypothetical protein
VTKRGLRGSWHHCAERHSRWRTARFSGSDLGPRTESCTARPRSKKSKCSEGEVTRDSTCADGSDKGRGASERGVGKPGAKSSMRTSHLATRQTHGQSVANVRCRGRERAGGTAMSGCARRTNTPRGGHALGLLVVGSVCQQAGNRGPRTALFPAQSITEIQAQTNCTLACSRSDAHGRARGLRKGGGRAAGNTVGRCRAGFTCRFGGLHNARMVHRQTRCARWWQGHAALAHTSAARCTRSQGADGRSVPSSPYACEQRVGMAASAEIRARKHWLACIWQDCVHAWHALHAARTGGISAQRPARPTTPPNVPTSRQTRRISESRREYIAQA